MRIPALICLGGAPYPNPFGKNPYRVVPKTCDLFPASRPVISNKNPNISNRMKWAQNIRDAKGGKFYIKKNNHKKKTRPDSTFRRLRFLRQTSVII